VRLATSGPVVVRYVSNMQAQDWLPVGFIFGMQKREGFGFVLWFFVRRLCCLPVVVSSE
jgi:hypothetical protein